MKGIRLYLYTAFGNLMVMLLGKVRAKYFFESSYWRWMWFTGSMKFSNTHYQAAFTDVFGLSVDYYEGKKILDIGCGPRGSLEWAPESSICFGLDPLAEKYVQMNGGRHRMTYVAAAAESMPFEDGIFDLISSFNSLDHVDDLEDTLAEVWRVLKLGGDFLVIADVHDQPALCEPVSIGWDLSEQLSGEFNLVFERRLKRDVKVYQSAVNAVPYDGGDYGLLVARFTKNST